MSPLEILIMALILGHVLWKLNRSYFSGLCVASFYLVWLPHELRIETDGALPELTIHRLIVLEALVVGILQKRITMSSCKSPLFRLFLVIFLAQIVSALFAADVGLGLKAVLSTIFENFLLYLILVSTIENAEHVRRLLAAMVLGLALLALIVCPVEYYTGRNIIGSVIPNLAVADRGGIVASFQHRIHLGYAMAMVVPVILALTALARSRFDSILRWIQLSAVVAACYFSESRGPWLGAMLGAGAVIAFSFSQMRKLALLLCLGVALLLLSRPGVRETVFTMINSVFVHDGEQEASAEYRRILWHVAWTKIRVSPTHFLFGCGGLSTETMDISSFFDRQRGGEVTEEGHSSWDSEWAKLLVQYGVVGFVSEVLTRLCLFGILFTGWRRSTEGELKVISSAAIASCAVYTWAMLTVAIFSPQLRYLFWAIAAVGVSIKVGMRSKAEETAGVMSVVPAESLSEDTAKAAWIF